MAAKYNLKKICAKKGFSLAELLIVIALIAVLSVIALLTMNYKSQVQKSRDAKRKNDLTFLENKIEEYYADYSYYPPPLGCSDGSCCFEIECNGNFLSPYIEKFPCDPQGRKYTYCADAVNSQYYKIYINLEFSEDIQIAKSGCQNGCLIMGQCFNYGASSPNVALTTESFCSSGTQTDTVVPLPPTSAPTPTIGPTSTPGPSPVPTPTVDPSGIYYACQLGRCNYVGNPTVQCGTQFPVCYYNDDTCGNCGDPSCLAEPQCHQ